jgi:hypothetical protein
MAKISLMQFIERIENSNLSLAEERNSPPKGYPKDKSQYAVPEEYLFPINDKEHTKAAISLFSKHKFKDEEQKRKAAKRILKAAKEFGIEVSKDTNVYKAAHSKSEE